MRDYSHLKPWRPGQSGNPLGRPAVKPELKKLAREGRDAALAAIESVMLMTPNQLRESLQNPDAPLVQHLVASVMNKALKEGCPVRAQFLMNYVLGRPQTSADLEKTLEDNARDNDGALDPNSIPSSVLIEVINRHAEEQKLQVAGGGTPSSDKPA